ncbi:MAG: metal-dependent transcriptional regulator [Ruminococcus sp.]|nr:metal-dependent transcriptional regulator [Ruminococcus sp.]
MILKESGEMYLETIYVLSKKSNYVRSIDVCEEMGYSKPSVSRAVGLLKEGGYLTVGNEGALNLTPLGKEIAEKTYERHTVLSKLFMSLGVSEEASTADACKIEHVISDETFDALKKHLNEHLNR